MPRAVLDTTTCARCHKIIVLADVPHPYWYHPDGETIWCWNMPDVAPHMWEDNAIPVLEAR